MILILRILLVAIWSRSAERLSRLTFCLKNSSDFFAHILGIPFIDNIQERCEVAVLLIVAVNTIIDGYESDISIRKYNFGIAANFQIITSKPAHIFYDNSSHTACGNFCNHTLEIRSLKVRITPTIVMQKSPFRIAALLLIRSLFIFICLSHDVRAIVIK